MLLGISQLRSTLQTTGQELQKHWWRWWQEEESINWQGRRSSGVRERRCWQFEKRLHESWSSWSLRRNLWKQRGLCGSHYGYLGIWINESLPVQLHPFLWPCPAAQVQASDSGQKILARATEDSHPAASCCPKTPPTAGKSRNLWRCHAVRVGVALQTTL